MCLGIPMRVVELEPGCAVVERDGEHRQVDIRLLGDVKPGTYVLVNADVAFRLIDDEEAQVVERAVRALEAALRGEDPSFGFEDLDREPTLPPHLDAERRRKENLQ